MTCRSREGHSQKFAVIFLNGVEKIIFSVHGEAWILLNCSVIWHITM